MKYRSLANGNIVELSDEAAEKLVPAIYEKIEESPPVEVARTFEPKKKAK